MPRQPRSIADGVPLVAHLERAADILEVAVPDLERALAQAGLAPWGTHQNGSPVFKWAELVTAAADAGLQVGRVAGGFRRRFDGNRRRVNAYGTEV